MGRSRHRFAPCLLNQGRHIYCRSLAITTASPLLHHFRLILWRELWVSAFSAGFGLLLGFKVAVALSITLPVPKTECVLPILCGVNIRMLTHARLILISNLLKLILQLCDTFLRGSPRPLNMTLVITACSQFQHSKHLLIICASLDKITSRAIQVTFILF